MNTEVPVTVHAECTEYVMIGDAAEFEPMLTAIRRAGAAGKPLHVIASVDYLTLRGMWEIQALAEGCGLDGRWRIINLERADLHLRVGSPERRRAVR